MEINGSRERYGLDDESLFGIMGQYGFTPFGYASLLIGMGEVPHVWLSSRHGQTTTIKNCEGPFSADQRLWLVAKMLSTYVRGTGVRFQFWIGVRLAYDINLV